MSLKLEQNPLEYDMPWRPNFEKRAVAAWVAAALVAAATQQIGGMPPQPFLWMACICGLMAAMRMPGAFRLHKLQRHLGGRGLSFVTLDEMIEQADKRGPKQLWLGYGFPWENRHTQRAFEILKRDWDGFGQKPLKKGEEQPIGQMWIHGVEPQEIELYQPIGHTEGHTLIAGTTGAGKTRLFDLLISQAILRGETVIIIDPKGDKEMRDNARRMCETLGTPERFLQFHPAFPEESVRINPLRNYSRVTEIASRLAALLPEMDTFGAFSWQALNNIAQGLVIADDRPTLIKLRAFIEGGPGRLVSRAVTAYANKVMPGWEEKAKTYMAALEKASLDKQANIFYNIYYDILQPQYPSPELEGLLASYKHDPTHFAKMVAGLVPIMNMLTSGVLGELLSPDPSDPTSDKPTADSADIINQQKVAYFGLDSLTDAVVSSAIGSILLSDLTSVAGDRYNYGEDLKMVNIFVDEAAEVVNDPFIQLLNKGRGAKMRLFVATQTIADFTTRLGSKDKAIQVLANINNIFALRLQDQETQEYVAENLPKTRVKYVMRTQGQNTDGEQPLLHGGNQGERLMEEEMDLFSPQLLGMLPNLEYIAKISGGKIIKGRLPILVGGDK